MPEDIQDLVSPEQVVEQERYSENPFAEPKAAASVRAGANMYGANSIETFCDAGALSLTHEDADGWVAYVNQFTPLNYRYRDSGVQVWQYYEDYDNWQDTYGADAVCAFYHSGHGGMDGNGVFYLPLGSAWAGNDCTAISSNMRLGNEHGRYMFFSTCDSLRVLGGHNPIRTWQPANLGLRMIFGFETVSWDNPNYGKFFWEEWRKNKSFSTAWLDASWRIAHDQAPSVVACGATQAEAQDRVFNERFFNRTRSSTSWWWWRWYNAARTAMRQPVRELPRETLIPRFRPALAERQTPEALADRFGIARRQAASAVRTSDGGMVLAEGEVSVAQDPTGGIAARFRAPNLENTAALDAGRARSIADDALAQFALGAGTELVFDRVIEGSAAGGTTEGSGRLEPARITETIVQFRQVVDGLPVISSDDGLVRVAIDNDGRLTQLQARVRQVEELAQSSRAPAASGRAPVPPNRTPSEATPPREVYGPRSEPDHERRLDAAVGRRLRDLIAGGATPVRVEPVPGTAEIGYVVRENAAQLVARRAIEIDFGSGYRKRYWVETEIGG